MEEKDHSILIQDYINLLGKTYIIMLSSLDEFFGAPLSTNEKVVLQILDDEPISMKEISIRTGLALSTLTSVIDKMEDKRLVRRRHSRTDRRMVKIDLAVSGRRVKTKFNQIVKQMSGILMEILPEEERRDFTSALEKTAAFLNTNLHMFKEKDVLNTQTEPFSRIFYSQFKDRQK